MSEPTSDPTTGRGDSRSTPVVAPIRYPARTKAVIAVVVTLALGGFIYAGLTADTDPEPEFTVSGSPGDRVVGEDGVEALLPGDGDEVLGQQRFGVDLAPGWTGELLLLPEGGAPVPLPEDELDRVEELNQIFYQPLPGKTVSRLAGGTNCVLATIWDQVRGRAATERERSWCFSVV